MFLFHGFKVIHGSGKHIEDALSGIKRPASDPVALAKGFFPLMQGAHLAEPERVSPALKRPDRVYPAALFIEPATAVRFFNNAETRCHRPQMYPGQIGHGKLEIIGQRPDFPLTDTDDAGVPRAAGPAATAFKTNPGFKKISGMILFVRVAFHVDFDL